MKQIKTLEDLQKIREEALRKVNIRSDRSCWCQTCDDGHFG